MNTFLVLCEGLWDAVLLMRMSEAFNENGEDETYTIHKLYRSHKAGLKGSNSDFSDFSTLRKLRLNMYCGGCQRTHVFKECTKITLRNVSRHVRNEDGAVFPIPSISSTNRGKFMNKPDRFRGSSFLIFCLFDALSSSSASSARRLVPRSAMAVAC